MLNLVSPEHSMHYNPFRYIKRQDDVVSIVKTLIKSTTPKDASKSEPFWENAEAALLQALVFYTWLADEVKNSERDFRTVIKLINECTIPADPKQKSPMDRRIDALENKQWKEPETGKIRPGTEHPSVKMYRSVMGSAEDTKRSIVMSCVARLQFLMNAPGVLDILTGRDEMDLESLGMGYRGHLQKKALYLIPPVTDSTFNAVITILYQQALHVLYSAAEAHTENCRLPIQVSMYMDEMANVPVPPDFEKVIATCRSYGIDISIFIQSLQQLKTLFKDDWATIVGCCDTLLFLGMGNDFDSFEYISKMIGKYSLEKRSTSQSQGSNGSSSQSDDVIQRALMLEQELRTMSNDREIIIYRGEQPAMDYKYRTAESENFKTAQELGPYRIEDYQGRLDIAEQSSVAILSKDEKKYEDRQPGKTLSVDIDTISRVSDIQIELNLTLPDSTVTAYMVAKMDDAEEGQTKAEEKEETMVKTYANTENEEEEKTEDSYRTRIAKYTYTDDQLQQACFAKMDGITDEKILEWFLPDVSAEEMERMRMEQMADLPEKVIRTQVR